MQGFISAGFAGIAFFIPTTHYVQFTLAFFWLLAFSSATHDIAADGFYMLGLNNKEQSFFVGLRNTFYRFASIFGQGVLVMLAGWLETLQNNVPLAWSITFYLMAGLFLALTIYHRFMLPYPDSDVKREGLTPSKLLEDFFKTFVSFFQKKHIGLMFFFLLTYRLGESQLAKIASPFLLDHADKGGLELYTATVGMIYGTIGVIALLLGGIISGFLVSRDGFKKCKTSCIARNSNSKKLAHFAKGDKRNCSCNRHFPAGTCNGAVGSKKEIRNTFCRQHTRCKHY